jgi:porin
MKVTRLDPKYKCGIALVAASVVMCSAADAASWADNMKTSPYLLGDWGGERSALSKRGVDFEFEYTNEIAHNFTGGSRNLTRSTGDITAGVTADLDKLWGIKHTSFAFTMTDRAGRSLDKDAGLNTSQQTQEVYGRGQTVWLTKLTLSRTFFDGRLDIEAGRDSEGSDFDLADCNFQNLSFCGPQGPNLYGSYWMSFPGSVWMARAKVNLSAQTYLKFGVYQQSPVYYEQGWEGRNAWSPLSPNGTTGVVLPLEFGVTPQIGGLNGSYRVGVMYNTGGMPNLTKDINGNDLALTGLKAQQSSQSYNVWLAISQRVAGTNGGEGVDLGLRVVAGDRATSALDRQITASVEYQNPFHRVGDRAGFAIGATHSSTRAAEYQNEYNALHPADASNVGTGYEYVTEVFYRWQALPSVSFQPDLQYYLHPGGTSKNSNVFVAGFKTVIEF